MRAWKRAVSLLLLVAIVSLTLLSTGCHGNKRVPSFEIPEGFSEGKPIEITFWAKNDTNMTQVDIYHRAIEEFESYYPNIKVKLKLYTDYGRIYNDVITNIATDTTPDVCITYPDHIATYMTGEDVVVPLDSLMKNKEYGLGGSLVRFDSPTVDEIVPKFLEECKIDGVYYAMPYMRSTEVCYVNRTYVEKLGFELPDTLTWEFMWQVAEAATEKNADGTYKVNGKKVMIPVIYKSTDNMMIQMLNQKDAGYSTDSGEVEIFNDTTKQILKDLAAQVKKGSFSTFKISSYPANFLNAGECIFAIDSTAGATWMGSEAPLVDIDESRLVEFETQVMTVPQFTPEDPSMISQGPSVCIFNKEDNEQVLASWLFVQYLLTNSIQIAYATTEGYAPVTTKAQESAEYRDYLSREGIDNGYYYDIKIKATKLLLENTENTFVTPVFNGSASLRDAAGYMIETVTKEVRRGKTVNVNKIFSDATSLYRLDGIVGSEGDLGPMPGESVALLTALAVAWVGIGSYFVYTEVKRKKLKDSKQNAVK